MKENKDYQEFFRKEYRRRRQREPRKRKNEIISTIIKEWQLLKNNPEKQKE